jgi:glycine betaine/proline transport system permease protein
VTATLEAQPAPPSTPPPTRTAYPIKEPWLSKRGNQVLVVLGVWIVLYFILKGHWTFADGQPSTAAQDKLQSFSSTLTTSRGTNPFFVYVIDPIRNVLNTYVTSVQDWIHSIGWTGPTFLATAIALVWAGWRYAILALLGFLSFGVLGLFNESMDTLTYTLCAVLLSVVIGVALGIYAGLSRGFNAFITPILDFMQILPTFAYLPLVTLFFLIGPASSLIVTMIYAVPPVIRLTAVGIREVSGTTVEAARSIGSTRLQLLRKVQLPMAKNTIVLGINQTTMAALSMVTIAALIGAPGLGQVVIRAIDALDIGAAFNAGLAIVVIAIVLDRVTTGVSQRTEKVRRSGRVLPRWLRPVTYGVGIVLAVFGIVQGQQYVWANTFPAQWVHPISDPVRTADRWFELHVQNATLAVSDWCTLHIIVPVTNFLTNSPWWLVVLGILVIAQILAGWRVTVVTAVCLFGCIGLGLWYQSMWTLGSVLIAAVVTMAGGTLLGVWAGRNGWVERWMRPLLDGLQTLPAFVYLPPCLALFGVGRVTGIFAAIVYAAPAVIKVVIEGIHGVSATTLEAAESSGSNRWQIIGKVQLPMSRPHLLLAFNQGVIYVLAMVVVGGLVGAQGLGLVVVQGFSQVTSLFGAGLAAGLAIVLLGVMLDRITQGAGAVRKSAVV